MLRCELTVTGALKAGNPLGAKAPVELAPDCGRKLMHIAGFHLDSDGVVIAIYREALRGAWPA